MSREEIAMRAWAEPRDSEAATGRGERGSALPSHAIVIDTETTIDATQRQLFGSYRILCLNDPDYARGSCREEGSDLRRRSAEARPAGVRHP